MNRSAIIVVACGALSLPLIGQEPAQPWTVERCVQVAQERHPRVLAQEAQLGGARSRTAIARGARWPQLAASLGYAHALDPQRLVPATANGEPGEFSDDILSAGLVASLPLYTGGRLSAAVRAALGEEEAEAASVERARQEIAAQVAVIAWQRVAQDDLIAAVESNRRAVAARRRSAELLLAQGKALRLDVLKFDARLADLDSALADERGRARVLDRQLVAALGGGLEQAPEIDQTLPVIDEPALEPESAWLQRALAQRADLRAAEQAIAVGEERVRAARAAHLPQVTAFAALDVRSGEDLDGFDDDHAVGSLGLKLSVPIAAGGQISGEVERQGWQTLVRHEQRRQVRLQIAVEVGEAWIALATAQERLVAARSQAAASAEVARIERSRLDGGQGTTNDVLDAEAAALAAEAAVIRAAVTVQIARWRLRLAVGDMS
jgi:outer membrane protein